MGVSLTSIASEMLPTGRPDPVSLGRCTVAEILGSSSLEASLKRLDLKTGRGLEFVDTEAKVASLVGKLLDLPTNPPSLYIDLEGVNLSRHGSISVLQIYVLPLDETYLVDIYTLKEKAFLQSASNNDQTLLGILQSPRIPKVFFDVRNDSDALFNHFNVKLAGVVDLQLMELATRYYSRKYVNGLAKCIDRDAPLTTDEMRTWKASKEKGLKLFAPEHGGSYDVFNVRPLPDDIKEYCVQDVRFLPKLWVQYQGKISLSWTKRVMTESANRVLLSQTATYDGKGKDKALAPVGW
jgi:exonuclease 3'-5' domain-containing protein 1